MLGLMIGWFLGGLSLYGIILLIWYVTDRKREKGTFTFSNIMNFMTIISCFMTTVACFVAIVALNDTRRESQKNAENVAKLFNEMGTQTQLFQQQQLQMKKNNDLSYTQLVRADSIATNTEKTLKNIRHQVEILSEMLNQEKKQVESLGNQIKTSQEILTYTKSSYLFSTDEDKKRKRELIQSIINEIKWDDDFLAKFSQLPESKYQGDFCYFITDSWDSMINIGWLGLLGNSQLVFNLSYHYANIRQIRDNLQRVIAIDSSPKPLEDAKRIEDVQKKLIAEAKRLARINLENSLVISKQLEKLLNSF
ncbi:MAG: hypothetical protein AB1422_08205 [bacterium]